MNKLLPKDVTPGPDHTGFFRWANPKLYFARSLEDELPKLTRFAEQVFMTQSSTLGRDMNLDIYEKVDEEVEEEVEEYEEEEEVEEVFEDAQMDWVEDRSSGQSSLR